MEDTNLLDKYLLIWKDKTENSFISEVFHYIKNQHGGSIRTPIGIIIGYLDPHPKYWNIKIIIRSDINYDLKKNRVSVIAKSAYKNKAKYYRDILRLNLKPSLPIDPYLPEEIIKLLVKQNICEESMSVSVVKERGISWKHYGHLSIEDID